MNFGFRPLINPGTKVSEVDLEGTLADRLAVHEQVRLRQHVEQVLIVAPYDESGITITNDETPEAA